jgi:hypothetical protein
MVTPQISGLSNGDTLAALAQQSTTCGMGDNTWPYLRGPNPHRMLLTSQVRPAWGGPRPRRRGRQGAPRRAPARPCARRPTLRRSLCAPPDPPS